MGFHEALLYVHVATFVSLPRPRDACNTAFVCPIHLGTAEDQFRRF